MPTIIVEGLEPGQVVVCAVFQPHEEYEDEPDDGEEEDIPEEEPKILSLVATG